MQKAMDVGWSFLGCLPFKLGWTVPLPVTPMLLKGKFDQPCALPGSVEDVGHHG